MLWRAQWITRSGVARQATWPVPDGARAQFDWLVKRRDKFLVGMWGEIADNGDFKLLGHFDNLGPRDDATDPS